MNSIEIKIIKEAVNISDKILLKCICNLNKFKTEIDVANYLRDQVKKIKLKESFPNIIAIGKNAAQPHHIPNNTKLTKGFLVIDFGIRYKGYCTDTTRTVFFGKPSNKEKELYNLVLRTQIASIKMCKPNQKISDIAKFSREIIKYPNHFIHSLGHGVGKRIHEAPIIRKSNNRKLKEHDIITIEPGLYYKNKLGIRIEDMVQVKNNPVILTKIPKKLIIV